MLREVADTHTIIWYALGDPRLSVTARTMMQAFFAAGDDVGISAITLIEMVYLVEKNRIPANTAQLVEQLIHDPQVGVRLLPVDEAVAQGLPRVPRDQVPDMPDRIIAATAAHLAVPLISRDGKIQVSAVPTIW